MSLVSRTTNLKSLRYGKDRLGGGSSNQPYIKSNIPDGENGLGRKGGPDFLLRGGLLTPGRVLNDVSRLTQMFFDFKSPNGLLFTAKQNILSRSAVATNGDGKALNEGIYLPTSTILQAAGNPFGIHLNKQGLDPTKRTGPNAGQNGLFDLLGITDPLGLPVYTEIVKKDSDSRLVRYLTNKYSDNDATELYSYSGGPGSTLGVGRTSIPIYKERTNSNTIKLGFIQQPQTYELSSSDLLIYYARSKSTKPHISLNQNTNIRFKYGVSNKYFSLLQDQRYTNKYYNETSETNEYKFSVYDVNLNTNTIGLQSNTENKSYTLTQQQLTSKNSSRFTPGVSEDFRKETANPNKIQTLPYLTKNIEQRVNLGNPGKPNKNPDTTPLDKITSYPLYKSNIGGLTQSTDLNDLVKFRIGVIDNNDPSLKTYIHFRAFLDSMNDSYSSDWQSQKFMGRGENFYRYNGFDRSLNLSWTVVAQSKAELIPMYQKLNYLASVCAPDYSSTGYMRGNLITLTVGGYLYEQVGIMKGITYDVPQESPWEIAIPYRNNIDSTGVNNISTDPTIKELPHMIKVTGFQFIPIHNFVPRVQQNNYGGINSEVTEYGKERYIALSKGIGLRGDNNYDRQESLIISPSPLTPLSNAAIISTPNLNL
jgi:hypothetical protein